MTDTISDGFKGQCLCGAVRYESAAPPMMMAKCHCRDCQYISGGEATVFVSLPKEAVEISGELKIYSLVGSSGKQIRRFFCGTCGTHIYSEADIVQSPLVFLKAGTMDKDAAQNLKTAMVFWADNANGFAHIDEDTKIFAKNPDSI